MFSETGTSLVAESRQANLGTWGHLRRGEAGLIDESLWYTVKILKFGTPQTIAIIVLKMETFDVTLH